MSTPSSTSAGRLGPFSRRRRADQFAQLLDGGPSGDALRTDPQLAPLVDLAQALRSLPLGPTPDFRSTLRQRLVAVAAVQGVGEVSLPAAVRDPAAAPGLGTLPSRINEWAEGWRVRRRLIVATAAASAVVVVGGVGLAGSRSLPGEPFYGVKRGVERVQLALAGSTEAKGERHLQFARTRLHEVGSLVHSPEAIGLQGEGSNLVAGGSALGGSLTSRVVSTLRDMDKETTAGTKDLTNAFSHSHDNHPLQVLAKFAADQRTKLVSVLPALPAAASSQAEESLQLIQRVDDRANSLLTAPPCSAACMTPAGPTPTMTPTPAPSGDDLGVTPCSCTQSDGSTGTDQSTDQPAATPTPTPTPTSPDTEPGPGNPQPPPSSSPSPSQPSLGDQVGGIISNLPVPVPTPSTPLPLPDLPPLPVPVPTIHLP